MRTLAYVSALLVAVCAVLGCRNLRYGEPENAGHLPRYSGMGSTEYFRRVAYDNSEQLLGLRKVILLPVKTAMPVRMEWFNRAGMVEQDLARVITTAGAAMREELSMHFVVLQDRSFIDDNTIIIEVMITDLAPIVPPDLEPSRRGLAVHRRAYAGMEAIVRVPGQRQQAVRIKDWRAGRQTTPLPLEDDDAFSDLASIFYSWGDRLGRLLKEEVERQPTRPDDGPSRGLYFDVPDAD